MVGFYIRLRIFLNTVVKSVRHFSSAFSWGYNIVEDTYDVGEIHKFLRNSGSKGFGLLQAYLSAPGYNLARNYMVITGVRIYQPSKHIA